MINHGQYTPKFLDTYFPENTRRVTVLRDPVTRFVSAWDFFNMAEKFNISPVLSTQEQIEEWFRRLDAKHLEAPALGMLLNHQFAVASTRDCYDGVTPASLHDVLYHLEHVFDHVLVQERLDESLVLLQHEMCWSLSDIVTEAMKITGVGKGAFSWMSSSLQQRIRRLTHYDGSMWDLANKMLDRKLAALPSCRTEYPCGNVPVCLDKHLELLREARLRVAEYCRHNETLPPVAFNFCVRLRWDVPIWTSYTRVLQTKKDSSMRNHADPSAKAYLDYDPGLLSEFSSRSDSLVMAMSHQPPGPANTSLFANARVAGSDNDDDPRGGDAEDPDPL